MTYAIADLVDAAACFLGEAAQKYMVIRKLLSRTGSSMVQKYYCLLRLSYSFKTAFLELSYGQGASSILDKSPVHISNHDIPSFSLAMRFKAQDLLG